jgi:predicted 3-demethylubiquinone-9 3-methyltransferase (glyoxalase superfamily)
MTEKITPCLWFNGQAQEAAKTYCAVFANAKITAQSPIVTAITVSGQNITLLDGGPQYKPNPSISLYYVCATEAEFDRIWNTLEKGATVLVPASKSPGAGKSGWLTDKYSVSWQLVVGNVGDVGQKVTPCFVFSGSQYGRTEEALTRYTSIFRNSKVEGIVRYGKNELPEVEGKIKHAQIAVNGQKIKFMEIKSRPDFKFTEGVSLTIHCESQQEIDYYWERLTESGEESMCGWLKDKFGVSWQIIPTMLSKIMSDPAKAGKAAQAFMSMRKLNIEQIVQASVA